MVLNSVGGVPKPRTDLYAIRLAAEAARAETKKILTQEITLTSKAPLKILELLESSATSGNVDSGLITECCKYLKNKGKDLDHGANIIALNHYFDTMRNLSRNTSIDSADRMKLLEIIELRARGWMTTQELAQYYAKKRESSTTSSRDNQQQSHFNLSTSTSSPSLSATIKSSNVTHTKIGEKQSSPEYTEAAAESPSSSGDVIKHSGKFQRPVKVPGKNFLKDEFVIKNSDSGKVNPGAKDRLLQITGPDESSINKAKYYIEDTIKRNASPVPCDRISPKHHQQPVPLNQPRQKTSASTPAVNKLLSDEESNSAFSQTISIGNEVLVISSSLPKLTQEAKKVLEEYFQRSKVELSFDRYDSESDDSDNSGQNVGPKGDDQNRPESGLGVTSSAIQSSSNTDTHSSDSNSEKKYQKSASHGSLASSSSFFSVQSKEMARNGSNGSKKIVYNREFLLKCANSELSKVQPHAIKIVTQQIPDIARKPRQLRASSVESAVA